MRRHVVLWLVLFSLTILSLPAASQGPEWPDAICEGHPWLPHLCRDADLGAAIGAQGRPLQGDRAGMLDRQAMPGEWHDPLDDTFGMSAIDGTTTLDGQIVLTQLVRCADIWYRVWAMAEGDDDKLYLGTSAQSLKAYDPTTGSVEDKGIPVPDEPYT